MNKLKITWMLLVMKFLYHILWIVDGLQAPYEQRGKITNELYEECNKIDELLRKELK